MAANDDYAAGPVSALQMPLPMAAAVGLDDVAAEIIALLLELLGWSVATAATIEALPDQPYRLVFIDEYLFTTSPIGSEPKFANWPNIALVSPSSTTTFIGTRGAKIYHACLPLDVAELETIIANAS